MASGDVGSCYHDNGCSSSGSCESIDGCCTEPRSKDGQHPLTDHYTPVLIIGNGPSGICLSYFLSGNWPYLTDEPHPNPILQCKLEGNGDQSLLDMDLEYLSEGLEGRSHNPVALLFDALFHPAADLGEAEKSRLEWRQLPSKAIDHIVLGKGRPGGSWWQMDDSVLTLSLGSWMELPDLDFEEWVGEYRETRNEVPEWGSHNRATLSEVAHYYEDYVKKKKLEENFVPYTNVTSVRRFKGRRVINSESGEPEIRCQRCYKYQGENLFEVKGEHVDPLCGCKQQFTVLSPNVVLATGMLGTPNKLNVPGDDLRFVNYSLKHLESAIQEGELSSNSHPVLVIGSGLSAADAVVTAQNAGIPVIHIFRRSPNDRAITLSSLPRAVYPEYHRVLQMMRGEIKVEGYTPLPRHHVEEFGRDFRVVITGDGTTRRTIVSMVVVLIGARPDLNFLPTEGQNLSVEKEQCINCKSNPVDVDPFTMETETEPGLYAMGPLIGDTFVRFATGGALAIASHLAKKTHSKTLCCTRR